MEDSAKEIPTKVTIEESDVNGSDERAIMAPHLMDRARILNGWIWTMSVGWSVIRSSCTAKLWRGSRQVIMRRCACGETGPITLTWHLRGGTHYEISTPGGRSTTGMRYPWEPPPMNTLWITWISCDPMYNFKHLSTIRQFFQKKR